MSVTKSTSLETKNLGMIYKQTLRITKFKRLSIKKFNLYLTQPDLNLASILLFSIILLSNILQGSVPDTCRKCPLNKAYFIFILKLTANA